MKFLTARAMARHKEDTGHHGNAASPGSYGNGASAGNFGGKSPATGNNFGLNASAGMYGNNASVSNNDSSSLSDSVRDSVIAAAVAIANGGGSPTLGGGGRASPVTHSPSFAHLAASNAANAAAAAAAAALKSSNGSRSNSPMRGFGGGGGVKRSLNEVALALAEDASDASGGVKSLEDEIQFEPVGSSSAGRSVFPEMQHLQRQGSVFPEAM